MTNKKVATALAATALVMATQVLLSPTANAQNAPYPTENVEDYPVKGHVGANGNTYWTDMNVTARGRYCDRFSGQCGSDTDVINWRITTDPGSISSKYSWTKVYSPNAGNFSEDHLDVYAINQGEFKGGDTVSTTGASNNGSRTFQHSSLSNTVVTIAYTGWALGPYGRPYGWTEVGAKTADALCDPPIVNGTSSNVCRY